MFSARIVSAFSKVAEDKDFWRNLKDEYIDEYLKNRNSTI